MIKEHGRQIVDGTITATKAVGTAIGDAIGNGVSMAARNRSKGASGGDQVGTGEADGAEHTKDRRPSTENKHEEGAKRPRPDRAVAKEAMPAVGQAVNRTRATKASHPPNPDKPLPKCCQ